jgi:hypothetical protein
MQSFERNGERYRFRESMKTKEDRKAEGNVITALAQGGHFEDRGGSILRAQVQEINHGKHGNSRKREFASTFLLPCLSVFSVVKPL